LRLTQEILTNFAGLLFNSEGEVLENAKGNTPLHLAVVIMRSNLLELPKIEMQLIHAKGSLLLHKNRKGFNPLHLTLMNGSQYNSDPINAVKLMLDNPYSNQLIRQTDSLGNLPIHIAARLPNIPLSLSLG
jgi:ankyrin repeat protein